MFANKQIVCIEYMEISEADEREIFRVRCGPCLTLSQGSHLLVPQRVQLGMALNYAEKMKAEAPTPRQTLVHELVTEFGMPLRTLGFNDRRDAGFRWIAQSLQTILDSRPLIKRSATTTTQQTTWLKDTAPLDPSWKKRMQHTYKLLVDTLKAHPQCLKVTRGPATIAPIDLVMMVLLVFEFQDKLSASRLADALHALRMAARDKTKDLMWKSEHMGHYLVFLDRLERLGEAALSPSIAKDASVPMDVDPPAKRQRTGGTFLLSFERMNWRCSPNDRLLTSILFPCAISTDGSQRLPQEAGTATSTRVIVIFRTAPDGHCTAITHHPFRRIRLLTQLTLRVHLEKPGCDRIHARNICIAAIQQGRSPCGGACGQGRHSIATAAPVTSTATSTDPNAGSAASDYEY